jgi:hypothetical protein
MSTCRPALSLSAGFRPCQPNTPAVLVSFGMGCLSKHSSFPRKRESSPSAPHFQWLAEWIPACAGMTAPGSTRISQMTPQPAYSIPLSRLLRRFRVNNGAGFEELDTRRQRGSCSRVQRAALKGGRSQANARVESGLSLLHRPSQAPESACLSHGFNGL